MKRICVSKTGVTKKIKPEDLEIYLSQGFIQGNINDKQKSQNKKWYNNGKENILIKDGEIIPEGYSPGMYQKRAGGYSKYKYVWYTNGIEQKRLSTLKGDSIPEGWWPGFSDSYKNNMSIKLKEKGNYHLIKKNYSDEYLQLYHDKNKLLEFVNNNPELTLDEMSKRFNCTKGSIFSLLNNNGKLQKKFNWYNKKSISSLEKIVIDYLEEISPNILIERHNRKLLEGKEIDIYLPEYKVGIECNGTYWHSDSAKGVEKNYHLNKSKLAEKAGIRLIHLYEWDILTDQVKSLLKIALGKVENKIYARKCNVKEISNSEAKIFNELNHLQGHRNAQLTYGLFYKGQLVQLMSFSKSKYNKNLKSDNSWEIIRGCPGSNNLVIGGVSKLLNHFIKEKNPDFIFSYCDFNKFDGRSYEACGMRFIGYTGPDKTWIIGGQPVKRSSRKYKELKEKAEYVVWGSGSKKYELILK